MFAHVAAFLVRWAASAVVLMLSVGWVTPGNPRNTFGTALLVAFLLSAAWYLTLAKFLWFLLLPWLLYVVIWLATVTFAYGVGVGHALLIAIAMAIISFLVSLVFGVRTL
ncbi:hypothetical protein [Anaeromyxobacter paludicola]|uniref:Phage holin family protein n=1 Tax=Anaeromyxobacter paludicola TaxID=2918171 RepID=A0ABM7XD53_9BACT|nr:hypothetical protein [Anaeromyxobacter paludicola]BDG09799.1 hypothetical protein AMPC_29120 [Anaeromyxobacter paludicola]